MAEPMYTIKKKDIVAGKEINRNMLSGCYFYRIEDETYSFFSKADVLLAEGVKSGKDFEFNLGPFTWVVRNFSMTEQQASGNWVADVPRLRSIKPPPDHDAEDEGSFTAQAGGHADETAVAASGY